MRLTSKSIVKFILSLVYGSGNEGAVGAFGYGDGFGAPGGYGNGFEAPGGYGNGFASPGGYGNGYGDPLVMLGPGGCVITPENSPGGATPACTGCGYPPGGIVSEIGNDPMITEIGSVGLLWQHPTEPMVYVKNPSKLIALRKIA